MKRGMILNLKPILEKFLAKEMSLPMAFAIIDFSADFSAQLTSIEKERIELVKKYGDKREDGNMEVIDEKKKEKFTKAFEKLLSQDIIFELLDTHLFESIKMTPQEAVSFRPLFK
jgi:hypothetical protein